MISIRPTAVAGQFYPADPLALQTMVTHFLAQASTQVDLPKAIIVPHAGYIYSGAIAASAYACLKSGAESIKRVVLLGPSHRVAFTGLAAPHADYFNTPLGNVSIDKTAIAALLQLPFVHYRDDAHRFEHSLEVQLPFLQSMLKQFSLIPLVVGEATPAEVAQVLAQFYPQEDVLIVISSDLSHYLDYATAQRIDQQTSHKIENLAYEQLQYGEACGRIPLQGLLALAKQHNLQVQTVDLRNSGDTAGDKARVVGYGAYIIN